MHRWFIACFEFIFTHTVIEPISPPPAATLGEKITFHGVSGECDQPLNQKKLLKILADLHTNDDGTLDHVLITCVYTMCDMDKKENIFSFKLFPSKQFK